MSSPGPSAFDIQNHLYSSFLQARTSDVALRVTGSWQAVYRLHRVVLIQSGFFRSLFTAGFIESSATLSTHYNRPDEIAIIFDDRNITRPAFEICISRLYGGGPPLYVSPGMVPSTSHPLTFFSPASESNEMPSTHHPASPWLLLSLLATATYLSVPSVAAQALSLILDTVGPCTIIRYLSFAIGKGIGHPDVGEPEAAVGLEHVAQIDGLQTNSTASIAEDDEKDAAKGSAVSQLSYSDSTASDDDSYERDTPSFHYGALSDKIGEACACWLARWATDMLAFELGASDYSEPSPIMSRKRSMTIPSERSFPSYEGSRRLVVEDPPVIWNRSGLNAKWIAAVVSADTLFVKGERERYEFARSVVELRRGNGVLEHEEVEWTRMFANGIYYANMTMDEIITISQDVSPITKRPFVPLPVLQAAHWDHSIFRHLITYRPVSSPSTTSQLIPPSSPPPRDKELGIALTTAEILAKTSSDDLADTNDKRLYFPIPGDASLRIGAGGSNFNQSSNNASITMDDLFNLSHTPSALAPQTPGRGSFNPRTSIASNVSTSEAHFFGLFHPPRTAKACVEADSAGVMRWSPYPPYRFAVEFWDLESLKEKSRLHSHTIWYAGSLFNIYVQVVRKKSQTQLGIYLHRQSSIDPIPPASAPASALRSNSKDKDVSAPEAGDRISHIRTPSLPATLPPTSAPTLTTHYSPSIHPLQRSTTPLITPSSARSLTSSSPSQLSYTPSLGVTSNFVPVTTTPVAPAQPYRDPRPQISGHFSISCASAVGSSQTRFTSAPDVFSVSQSWGWKSSSLRTEEYIEVELDGKQGPASGERGKEVSLRATVVLGLV